MSESIEFIIDRSTKTLSAARAIASEWAWQEKPVAAMAQQLVAIVGDKDAAPPVPGQEKITSQAAQAMRDARSAWDAALDTLHRRTMQGVAMVKTRFREDAAKFALVEPLSAGGDSRADILAEALAWESAWEEVDATWAPLPANTLAAFQTLRHQCTEDLRTAYSDTRAAWRKQGALLAELAAEMNDVCVAWYADAVRVFPAGTPQGDMIRGTIPTTYSPRDPAPPAPAPAAG
jgi:hypothetical protein